MRGGNIWTYIHLRIIIVTMRLCGRNKLAILDRARLPFKTVKPDVSLYALAAPDTYEWEQGKNYPAYFERDSYTTLSRPTVTHRVASPYTYGSGTYEPGSFWVDFADTYLGGGVFGNGFLQEETMCCEIPELANAAGLRWWTDPGHPSHTYTLYTRGKTHPSPTPHDFPTPLVLRKASRTFDVGMAKITKDTIVERVYQPAEINQGATGQRPVNVLAMGTRKVSTQDALKKEVIYDLFNTFVAGFQLARDTADAAGTGPRVKVNTGQIGTGNFNNNFHLVYILQVLAARYVGVDEIYLCGYSGPDGDKSQTLLKGLDDDFKSTDEKVLTLLDLIPKQHIPAS